MPVELDEISEGAPGPCVRVATFQGSPDVIERAVELTMEHIVPALRSAPGWTGAIGLVSLDGRRAITLTFWESEDALVQSSRRFADVRTRAVAAGLSVAEVERFRVVFEEK